MRQADDYLHAARAAELKGLVRAMTDPDVDADLLPRVLAHIDAMPPGLVRRDIAALRAMGVVAVPPPAPLRCCAACRHRDHWPNSTRPLCVNWLAQPVFHHDWLQTPAEANPCGFFEAARITNP